MPTTPATIAAAQLLLRELGVTPDQLDWIPVEAPTIADYLPQVISAAGPGAQRTYGSYWNRILTTCGERHLDEIHTSDIEALMRHAVATRRHRRSDRGGTSSSEHMLRAFRAIYTLAVADGLLPPHHNPAAQVRKPRRPPSQRHGLSTAELTAINTAASCSGNDVRLDTLLLRLHTETAARRCGALRLRVEDIDTHWCLLGLREKNNSTRWQPASPQLIDALLDHINERGDTSAESPALRSRDGTPVTTRRYDQLWRRLGEQLPWVAAQHITTHWLRHTTITWVERHFGYGIARAYAGHTDTSGASTTTYIQGQLGEVATALAALTGLPHPLAAPLSRTGQPDGPTARDSAPPSSPYLPHPHPPSQPGSERRD
ncbi:tyrosine-type recombinase/integrase [Kutzneria sp. CA-103260]|uniref:tyrosine-type recombinase/integrase n=1 Tax=Kutzneria sp. CA-103260 TaxID=2802641 RepID=UPI001BA603A0|nr:site-specific integrase [Kutzneria sp. CA-103260]QUQ64611.1 Tyrosine recombinase XerC [Kutzneria sp. CA-103260]